VAKAQNNYAFIDSQNLNLSIHKQGWALRFRKFRQYLRDKYSITRAFLFIGYVYETASLSPGTWPTNLSFYTHNILDYLLESGCHFTGV
jgi:hypothetical protein